MGTQGRLDDITKTRRPVVARPDWYTSMNRFVNIFAMQNAHSVREKYPPCLAMRRLKCC